MSWFTHNWGKFSYLLETRLCKRFDKYHVCFQMYISKTFFSCVILINSHSIGFGDSIDCVNIDSVYTIKIIGIAITIGDPCHFSYDQTWSNISNSKHLPLITSGSASNPILTWHKSCIGGRFARSSCFANNQWWLVRLLNARDATRSSRVTTTTCVAAQPCHCAQTSSILCVCTTTITDCQWNQEILAKWGLVLGFAFDWNMFLS